MITSCKTPYSYPTKPSFQKYCSMLRYYGSQSQYRHIKNAMRDRQDSCAVHNFLNSISMSNYSFTQCSYAWILNLSLWLFPLKLPFTLLQVTLFVLTCIIYVLLIYEIPLKSQKSFSFLRIVRINLTYRTCNSYLYVYSLNSLSLKRSTDFCWKWFFPQIVL